MTKITNITNKPAAALRSATKRVRIPGTQGATIYDIGSAFLKSIKDIRLSERAAAISFNFLMAIPPSLIFLVSLVPFLGLSSVEKTMLDAIRLLSPNPGLMRSVQGIVTDFMHNKQRELLSLGFLVTIFLSSNGVMGILRSFDRDSPGHVRRTDMARRWKALRLTLGLMLVFLVSITLIIIQTNLLDKYVADLIGSTYIIKLISWITLVALIYTTICILYKYGPSLQYRFPFFSTGALVATLLFLIISSGFFFIAGHIINYDKIYGSIGTLLVFMIWMFITGLVILIGYEINLVILLHSGKISHTGVPPGKKQNKKK